MKIVVAKYSTKVNISNERRRRRRWEGNKLKVKKIK